MELWYVKYQHSIGLFLTGLVGGVVAVWRWVSGQSKKLDKLSMRLGQVERRCMEHRDQIIRDLQQTRRDNASVHERINESNIRQQENHAAVMNKLGEVAGELKHLAGHARGYVE